ncbi:NUDIX domain-containing protein [Kineosporia sp. J2-2]|uniref:NUDIX domain-containing protein n=1 Tax=Kineosporia corallincola TaxID=2835133 RepID=A0ABS5TSD2_9ACTN|nr:NUDIX domain-containing protein [Kineosporia corallincola]MBT0773693.1 NUDIX domain-containing protein [Kineosporia corallincola]
MISSGQRCALDVLLILTRGEQVLFGLRQGTGFADGLWNLPSGKAEFAEPAVLAVIREAHEEIGLTLSEDDLVPSSTIHVRHTDADTRIGIVFHAELDPARHGEPYNAEPGKCARLGWFPLTAAPAPALVYSTEALRLHRAGLHFGTLGWGTTDSAVDVVTG